MRGLLSRFILSVTLMFFFIDLPLEGSHNKPPIINGVAKDPINREAVIYMSDPDGSCSEEVPCKYYSLFEHNIQSVSRIESVPEYIMGRKHEHYYIPSRPGGNCVVDFGTRVIIPRFFREDTHLCNGVLNFLRKQLTISRVCPLPREPSGELANGDCHSSLVPDNGVLRWAFNSYIRKHPYTRLDDNVLVLCLMVCRSAPVRRGGENIRADHYPGLIINGSEFGIFEMKRNEYQNLCHFRERKGRGSEAAPVVIFNDSKSSFRIVDESASRIATIDVDHSLDPHTRDV